MAGPGLNGLTLKIAGIDRSDLVVPSSIDTTDNLSARNTLQLTLWDNTVTYHPEVGSLIEIFDTDGVTYLFAGSIDEVTETLITGITSYLQIDLQCVDRNQVCDRHLVVAAYVNPTQTLRDIVLDVVANNLTDEGVNTSSVAVGPVIPETKVFNYKTVTQVFNELQQLTNYIWWIDYTNTLNFVPRTGVPSMTTLSKDTCLTAQLQKSRSVGPYRNRQYVRAGTAKTDQRTEHLTGDGVRKTYNVAFEVDTLVSITLNGASKTVGVLGLDTGKDFYFAHGSNSISQDDGATPLVAGNDLAVTYIGQYPLVVQAQSDSEIATRKLVEGGSGIYESIKTDQNLNDLPATKSLAQALLSRYGFIPKQLQVTTDVVGIRSGQLIQCTFPELNLDEQMLVQEVQGKDQEGQFMRYTVTLVDG